VCAQVLEETGKTELAEEATEALQRLLKNFT